MSERTAPNPAASYESYQVRYLFAPWSLGLIDRVRPQPGERVLDLVCGTGAVARETVKRISPGGSVVGVDISPDMLRVASEIVGTRDGVVQWQQASADSLPLPYTDSELDAVTAFVHRGRGLLLMTDHRDVPGRSPDHTEQDARLAACFGVTIERASFSSDAGPSKLVTMPGGDHPVLDGVRTVVTMTSTSVLADQGIHWSLSRRR